MYYGLIPQTYCGDGVAGFSGSGPTPGVVGDGDPLDICVLTEKTIPHSDILLTALPIGGLSMADGGEADDKIIAVMQDDATYGGYTDLKDSPMTSSIACSIIFSPINVRRDMHHKLEITSMYGREKALKVIRTSHKDYKKKFPELESMWPAGMRT